MKIIVPIKQILTESVLVDYLKETTQKERMKSGWIKIGDHIKHYSSLTPKEKIEFKKKFKEFFGVEYRNWQVGKKQGVSEHNTLNLSYKYTKKVNILELKKLAKKTKKPILDKTPDIDEIDIKNKKKSFSNMTKKLEKGGFRAYCSENNLLVNDKVTPKCINFALKEADRIGGEEGKKLRKKATLANTFYKMRMAKAGVKNSHLPINESEVFQESTLPKKTCPNCGNQSIAQGGLGFIMEKSKNGKSTCKACDFQGFHDEFFPDYSKKLESLRIRRGDTNSNYSREFINNLKSKLGQL